MSDQEDFGPEDDASLQVAESALPERAPADIERQVGGMTRNSPLGDICAMLDAAHWLLGRAKLIDIIARQKAIDWIDIHGPFDIGPFHYDVGHTTTIRCTNIKRCGHQLLEHLEGDLDALFDVLVAQPFKPSAAKHVLSATAYQNLFIAKVSSRLVVGLPQRVLKRTNVQFLR